MMGCTPNNTDGCVWFDMPGHYVWLPTYAIDLYEVTESEYAACVSSFVCSPPGTSAGCTAAAPDAAQLPIDCVRWGDAQDMCAFAGKRLCTEAEWEKAARGDDFRPWPWGMESPTCAFASSAVEGTPGCGTGGPEPVGSHPAGVSPYGAHDMAGNVAEWVFDWFDAPYYQTSPEVSPVMDDPPPNTTDRGHRGGSWSDGANPLRVTSRGHAQPWKGNTTIGIRCCKDFP